MRRRPNTYLCLSQRLGIALAVAVAVSTAACGGTGGETQAEPEGAGTMPGGAATPAGPAAPQGPIDPGRVTVHRLNRVEYNNTVRDLLGTSLRPADDFPADDRGHGFDNIGDVLSLSPLQIELYQRAAEILVDELFASGSKTAPRVLTCAPATGGEACVSTILKGFARRAWRRPPSDDEVASLRSLMASVRKTGDSEEEALRAALEAVVLSPHFIFRVEIDPAPDSLEPHTLSGHELAARLSYFLWSSMPDSLLDTAADAGSLGDPKVLGEQVTRMLANSRASALTDNFAGQWLFIRRVDESDPDRKAFPMFDSSLRDAMRSETRAVFRDLLSGALPLARALGADFTYVNDRLARHYGLPMPGSTTLMKVSTTDTPRVAGLLSQGTYLMVTSHPERTSPVLRGRWVLDQLLCQSPPDPPPGVEGLVPEIKPSAPLRKRLEQHRANPTCAGCHTVMDAIGFGLENFDAIGAFRMNDGPFPIDAAAELPEGRKFRGPEELGKLLAADPAYLRCVAEKVATYALGRGPLPGDDRVLQDVVKVTSDKGGRFGDLVDALVKSPIFRSRRGEPAGSGDGK